MLAICHYPFYFMCKNAKIGVKATNIPDTHYKLFFDMIMGDILFGPIYSLTENVFMFNMGYSVSL